jgi:hypothetical protein
VEAFSLCSLVVFSTSGITSSLRGLLDLLWHRIIFICSAPLLLFRDFPFFICCEMGPRPSCMPHAWFPLFSLYSVFGSGFLEGRGGNIFNLIWFGGEGT